MNTGGNIDIMTPGGILNLNNEDFNIADIAITPVSLTWMMPPNWFVNTGLQVPAPTGAYDANKGFQSRRQSLDDFALRGADLYF
ncbi:hypothetical protein AJ87_17010 [Rhizobium yanglingense]|nr:hypothetical protein AJ87_17010 [Rhizobium yanglingense]